MKCRDFLVEFEDRNGDLSEAATVHITICAECRKTSEAQTKLWLLMEEMPRVEAPNNFDFRVKARIAQGKPVESRASFFPALRYVLPVAFVVLLIGFIAFNANYFTGANPIQTAAIVPQTAPVTNQIPANSFAESNPIATPETAPRIAGTIAQSIENPNLKPTSPRRETQFVVDRQVRRLPKVVVRENPRDEEGGGSRDNAFTPPPPPILPEGFNTKPPTQNQPNANIGNQQNQLKDAQILEFIGIETVADRGGRKVKSVKSDSLADRSGVKVGDVVEAIDGKKVSEEPRTSNEGKTLTVKRGAERIEIKLENK